MNVTEEKRIYVVVPVIVEVADRRMVKQPVGRQVAQAVHVVSKLRVYETVMAARKDDPLVWIPCTTIILSARDSKEMGHVWELLKRKKINVAYFGDTNLEYGAMSPITAICTEPVLKKQVEGILDYLPLWPGEQK